MMWKRLIVIDVSLMVLLIAGIFQVRESWKAFEVSHRLDAVQPETEISRTLPTARSAAPAIEDWSDISLKNPFSFDRNDVSIVAQRQTLPAQPKPVLFGTMAIGKEWIAMLAPGQTGSRTSRAVKVGESVESWKVVEIREKSVVVAADNGVQETIIMNDPTANIPRDASRTLAGAGQPSSVTVGSPVAPPAPTAGSSAPPPPAPTAGQPPSGQKPPTILHTPFGDVIKTDP